METCENQFKKFRWKSTEVKSVNAMRRKFQTTVSESVSELVGLSWSVERIIWILWLEWLERLECLECLVIEMLSFGWAFVTNYVMLDTSLGISWMNKHTFFNKNWHVLNISFGFFFIVWIGFLFMCFFFLYCELCTLRFNKIRDLCLPD